MEFDPALQYLASVPEPPALPPPVETAVQVLPFDQLTWQNFERLCYRLIRADDEVEDARLFGGPGQDQSGIDIFARRGDAYSTFQCRRVAELTGADIALAVDDFLDGDWVDRSHRFVLCTSRRAVHTDLEAAIDEQKKRLAERDQIFEVWDQEELSARLKEHPALVADFFGLAWRDAFIPDAEQVETSAQLAELAAGVRRLEDQWLRVRLIDWAPEVLSNAMKELARDDPGTYARLDDAVGDPPSRELVVSTTAQPGGWLAGSSDPRPWRILAMLAERMGEWNAARLAWVAAADRSESESRAGLLVSAATAADLADELDVSATLMEDAEKLSPTHPRLLLARLDQKAFGAERLAELDGLEADEPVDGALLATHRALAYMLLGQMDEADRWVAEARQLMPDSLMVRAVSVNALIHHGRIAASQHRVVDYPTMLQAHKDALSIRAELLEVRRYEEALRLLMLAADALTVVKEPTLARGLISLATEAELATNDGPTILADAALRAQGWHEALSVTSGVVETESVRRIRATAELEFGGLYEQNRALTTLGEIVSTGGREAAQAAHIRLAATLLLPHAEWSDDAFDVLVGEGFESTAVVAKALFLAKRRRDYAAADALLKPHASAAWAAEARVRVALLCGDRDAKRETANDYLDRGAVQEDRVLCAVALRIAGEAQRAHDVLMFVARDLMTPPGTRADAYSLLVTYVAEVAGDWEMAAELHREWTKLRPGDPNASAWAPRIANHLLTRSEVSDA